MAAGPGGPGAPARESRESPVTAGLGWLDGPAREPPVGAGLGGGGGALAVESRESSVAVGPVAVRRSQPEFWGTLAAACGQWGGSPALGAPRKGA